MDEAEKQVKYHLWIKLWKELIDLLNHLTARQGLTELKYFSDLVFAKHYEDLRVSPHRNP